MMTKTSKKGVARVVLEGVPRVGFQAEPGRDAETTPFPACLRACLEYMGDDLGWREFTWRGSTWQQSNTYVYLMGVTGAAFRLSWRPGWHLDNTEIMYMSNEPCAPFERAFEAIGYDYEFLFSREEHNNQVYWRQHIIESIRDQKRPVLGFGVVGPPECCIIAGYDEGGDVLIGWSFFQHFSEFNAGVEFEPSGYFRKRNWFQDTQTPLIIGEKRKRPSPDEICRQALHWALQVARTTTTTVYDGDRHNGLAAYQAWADHLSGNDEFPVEDMGALHERYTVHNDAVGLVAEARWYAACFLRKIADREPSMAGDLLAAAACYETEHDLMWQLWNLVGGIGFSDEHVKKLADPQVRRQMVPIILQARDEDEKAAAHVEKALSR
jgi:hypothetical protein